MTATAFRVLSFEKVLVSNIKISTRERSFAETWQAEANQAFTDPSLQLAKLLPPLLKSHPDHPEMKLLDINYPPADIKVPNEQKVLLLWSNVIQIGNGIVASANTLTTENNPRREPAIIEYYPWTTVKLWDKDINGKPFATTAGEPIIHQEEVEYSAWHVEINVPKYPAIFGAPSAGPRMFINSDKVKFAGDTFQKHTLLIRGIRLGRLSAKNDFLFYPMSYEMMHNPDTWLVKKRNAGYICLMPHLNNNTGANLALNPKYVLKPTPIKVGKPEQYPSQPVPIQNKPNKTAISGWPDVHGMPFPEYIARDPQGVPTGFVDQAEINKKRLEAIWKETELTFTTKNAIKFTGKVPGI